MGYDVVHREAGIGAGMVMEVAGEVADRQSAIVERSTLR